MSYELPPGLRSIFKDLVSELSRVHIPQIQHDTYHFSVEGWTVIEFEEAFSEPPRVVPSIEAPRGMPTEEWPYPPPEVLVSAIKLATAAKVTELKDFWEDWEAPLRDGKTYPEWLAERFAEMAENYLSEGNFLFQILGYALSLVDIRDDLIRLARKLGEVVGKFIIWTYQNFIRPYLKFIVDNLREIVKDKFDEMRDRVNDAISDFRTNIQNSLNEFKDGLQGNVDDIAKHINDAYNRSIDKLYEYINIEKGNVMIPALIRQGSVTNTSFEVWSPGYGTLHWIAVGRPHIPRQSLINRLETIIGEV